MRGGGGFAGLEGINETEKSVKRPAAGRRPTDGAAEGGGGGKCEQTRRGGRWTLMGAPAPALFCRPAGGSVARGEPGRGRERKMQHSLGPGRLSGGHQGATFMGVSLHEHGAGFKKVESGSGMWNRFHENGIKFEDAVPPS